MVGERKERKKERKKKKGLYYKRFFPICFKKKNKNKNKRLGTYLLFFVGFNRSTSLPKYIKMSL